MSENIQKIIDRLKTGNYTPDDVLEISSAISTGKLVLASGSGAVAIGGDASNARIITGKQNIIGDRNTVIYIYGAESQVIQSVVDRYSVIDNTFQQLFPPSTSSGIDWDWGMKLLKQKQLPEIRKRLTDTLGRDRILMDVSIEEQQNWVNRSPLAADRTLQINGEDFGTLDANKMLIETFGRDDIERKLLILGAPGAGKTTALLSLAEQLVCGAISQPRTVIPVIKEIASSFCIAIAVGFVSWLIINITFPWIFTEHYSIQLILTLALPLVMASNISSSELQETTRPNEGIWRSFGNAWKVSLVGSIWLGLSAFMMKGEIFNFLYYSGLERSATLSFLSTIKIVFPCVLVGLFVGLILGGTALIQHLSLRIVLWQSGLPWNFKQFLNYCVERRLLLCVGGSYRFLHRELLDHFAQSNHLN
jgi:DNA polymerase III delta prime subunit